MRSFGFLERERGVGGGSFIRSGDVILGGEKGKALDGDVEFGLNNVELLLYTYN